MRVFGWLFGVWSVTAQAAPLVATTVVFEEQEAGGGSGSTRMLVTPTHLRIDEDEGSDGYILFDRRQGTIYSVSHGDKTVLVIQKGPIALMPPVPFRHAVERVPEALPRIGGREVMHLRLTTNGARCYDLFAVSGLLPQVVMALEEFHRLLASEQSVLQARMPATQQNVCDAADFVFVPTRHLEHGFPVRLRRIDGSSRALLEFHEDRPVAPDLFSLPAGYRHYTAAEMRGGR